MSRCLFGKHGLIIKMAGLVVEVLSFLDVPVSVETSTEAGVIQSSACLQALVLDKKQSWDCPVSNVSDWMRGTLGTSLGVGHGGGAAANRVP